MGIRVGQGSLSQDELNRDIKADFMSGFKNGLRFVRRECGTLLCIELEKRAGSAVDVLTLLGVCKASRGLASRYLMAKFANPRECLHSDKLLFSSHRAQRFYKRVRVEADPKLERLITLRYIVACAAEVTLLI